MTFVFPMAGLSSRFTQAGFTLPKYMLETKEGSVLLRVLKSFEHYKSQKFLFIYREIYNTKDFIVKTCETLNISNPLLVPLHNTTLGQAHTIYLGLKSMGIAHDQSLLIFNIDTFRPNFQFPSNYASCDGYLEVFMGFGNQWSFILPGAQNTVLKTTEKDRISSLCSSGLYYFKHTGDFLDAFTFNFSQAITHKGEYYVAPLYNYLIQKNKDIRYFEISKQDIIFCGTPEEYYKLI